MSTTSYQKTITLRSNHSATEKRAAQLMQRAEQGKYGEPTVLMREWIQAGMILSELGHGLVGTLISHDSAGLLEGLSPKEKAEYICRLMENTPWRDIPPAPPVEAVEKPVVKAAVTTEEPAPTVKAIKVAPPTPATEEVEIDVSQIASFTT
ncbi:hypothetical protein [Endozoicomonas lisbonensis]